MDYQKLSKITDSVNKQESRNHSIKDSVEHFSPQMEELVEAFDNMDDVDETVVTVSEEIPQEEIDEFVSRYMEHNPEGEEEFILTITPLGNKQYKISCPYVWDKTHQVEDSKQELTFANAWDGDVSKAVVDVVFYEKGASLGRDVCIIKVGDKFQDLIKVGNEWEVLTSKDDDMEPSDMWEDTDVSVKCPDWFTQESLADVDALMHLVQVEDSKHKVNDSHDVEIKLGIRELFNLGEDIAWQVIQLKPHNSYSEEQKRLIYECLAPDESYEEWDEINSY